MMKTESGDNNTTELLDFAAIMEKISTAEDILNTNAHVTPIESSATLNRRIGHQAYLKCEQLQRAGAFKFRGAFYALSCLSAAQKKAGVLTYSSGNHAQAMALAGQILGVAVTVVMPENAPKAKLAATRGYGANVVLYNPRTEKRESVAANLPQAMQATLIPPFDHYDVIAGQGTAAKQLFQQLEQQQRPPLKRLLVPVGGGGLLAGTAIATHFCSAGTRVIGVEPENANDAAQSFRAGRIVSIENPDTIADGTRTSSLGVRNFAIIRELVDDIVVVSEQQIKEAVRFLFERLKLVVEPSGALGVAALLADTCQLKGRIPEEDASGVILSGGNVNNKLFAQILTEQGQMN